jgi:hypothetical protein
MKIRLAILTALILTTGCVRKDDLTLPVRINFKIGIETVNSAADNYLDFAECSIGIQRIDFEGNREAGVPVCFMTDPALDLHTLSFNHQPVTISKFDIPQGIYNSMQWDISMKCIDTEGLINDRGESYPCIGIIFKGNYTTLSGSVIPLIFAIDRPELFRVMSYAPNGDQMITLTVGREYEAVVYFAPDRAFSAISRNSLETAVTSEGVQSPEIVISSSMNQDLYQILLYRIFLSASVVVK